LGFSMKTFHKEFGVAEMHIIASHVQYERD